MEVSIKRLDVQMPIKKKGVELSIADTKGKHLGDLVITQTGLNWCKGKTHTKGGEKKTWYQFIALMVKRNKSEGRSRKSRTIRQKGKKSPYRKEWTYDEIRKLREGYKNKTAAQLASELGRSLQSVRGKIASLKLKKHR